MVHFSLSLPSLPPSQFGNNQAVHEALQLNSKSSCNVSLNSGKKYAPGPLRYNTMPAFEDSMILYVDPNVGNDKNSGTEAEPLKTIYTAVLLMRLNRHLVGGNPKGIIYLKPGRYHPNKPINLTPDDSNLAIVGSGVDKTIISGAREYTFDWKLYKYQAASMVENVSVVDDTIYDVIPGSSPNRARLIMNKFNASDCKKACDDDPTCFAYTWFDKYAERNMSQCYFRTDGIWAPTTSIGATSGKKLKIMMTDLRGQNPTTFTTLFLNGRRAVRARYPDGNPETMGLHTYPTGYMDSAEKWLPPVPMPASEEVHIGSPKIPRVYYASYDIGIGGPVEMFDPPKSYWGVKEPIGGAGGIDTYQVPSGLVYSPDEEFASRSWKNASTGVVHAFHHLHWGNWQFKIDTRDEQQKVLTWTFGGFQEARGCKYGQEWFIDNIFEELDAPGEWFYDETEQKLYLYPNGTNDSLPTSGFGTELQRLLNIRGTIDNPVYNVTVVNITFTQTEPTFFEKYTAPSGGDWSIHRGGTVYVEGVDGFTIQNCLFDAPGGNGLFLSNYVRNAVIEANEFRYTGDSAVAALGSTEMIDGTSGNQPRGTKILNNLMHENGIYGKQSAAYFQSLTCQTEFDGNILFNGPRDGVNHNDNFGGGNILKNNLAFNFVRETADCGPFNFFDRVPYITTLYDGYRPSLLPAMSYISYNYVITNYHSIYPLDHDDGSCYWVDTNNFLVYGGYKNHIGHSKVTKNNTYVRPDAIHYHNRELFFGTWPYCAIDLDSVVDNSGWGEIWADNKCVIGHPNVYNFTTCNPEIDDDGLVPTTMNNHFYVPNKDLVIKCGGWNLTLDDYQRMGKEIGSEVHEYADASTIIKWGSELFGL